MVAILQHNTDQILIDKTLAVEEKEVVIIFFRHLFFYEFLHLFVHEVRLVDVNLVPANWTLVHLDLHPFEALHA